jgi:hypothetical protein
MRIKTFWKCRVEWGVRIRLYDNPIVDISRYARTLGTPRWRTRNSFYPF